MIKIINHLYVLEVLRLDNSLESIYYLIINLPKA